MNDQIIAATIRAAYGAAITGLFTLLTTYQLVSGQTPSVADPWQTAWIAAGVAALGYLMARGGIEGIIDGQRAAQGKVSSADVGAYLPPIERVEPRTGRSYTGR